MCEKQKANKKDLAKVNHSRGGKALKKKPKTSKNIQPFVTSEPKLREIVMKNWYPNAPIVAYR